LSGEKEQGARQRALAEFKRGDVQVLVATDVAARGIDHQDIARVVQLEPPNDADTYTHRSGRTGRAGRKGKSSIMVVPAGLPRLTAMLKRAGVRFRLEPIPSAAGIAAAQDEKFVAELMAEPVADETTTAPAPSVSERTMQLVTRLVASGGAERALGLLIERARSSGVCAPRELTPLSQGPGHPVRGHAFAPRPSHPRERRSDPNRAGRPLAPPRDRGTNDGWVRFRVSWGRAQGADARRLVPMLCRRGNIRGADIGSIQLTPTFSFVDVATRVATDFERATQRPDPRDPGVIVRRERD
jgi:ATP-dependent RNA helicase DeaD